MNTTTREVLEFIKESDIKFVRLSFCDLTGTQKKIAIMADELESAFNNGVSFDAHAIKGFKDVHESDLLLFPDPATLSVLPWHSSTGRMASFYCTIKNPDGTDFLQDARHLLKTVITKAEKKGFVCKVGAECEFYLFKLGLDGEPTLNPIDNGGYLDVSPLDKAESIRREICLTLDQMSLNPEISHHEQGPGQNEISFRFSDALESADNLLTFKSVVRAIAQRNGLFASFMPKPLPDCAGSGLHINLSLSQNGANIFKSATSGEHSADASSFIAGILDHAPEISVFVNPTVNSYLRLGKFEAPKYVSWSHYNRSQLIRIPVASGEKVRMELRSPDPTVNPYLAFALIIASGLDGIERKLELPKAVNADLYEENPIITDKLIQLPSTLHQALQQAQSSEFIKKTVNPELLKSFFKLKNAELEEYNKATNKQEYFNSKLTSY